MMIFNLPKSFKAVQLNSILKLHELKEYHICTFDCIIKEYHFFSWKNTINNLSLQSFESRSQKKKILWNKKVLPPTQIINFTNNIKLKKKLSPKFRNFYQKTSSINFGFSKGAQKLKSINFLKYCAILNHIMNFAQWHEINTLVTQKKIN
jgi:hypothetical protein